MWQHIAVTRQSLDTCLRTRCRNQCSFADLAHMRLHIPRLCAPTKSTTRARTPNCRSSVAASVVPIQVCFPCERSNNRSVTARHTAVMLDSRAAHHSGLITAATPGTHHSQRGCRSLPGKRRYTRQCTLRCTSASLQPKGYTLLGGDNSLLRLESETKPSWSWRPVSKQIRP